MKTERMYGVNMTRWIMHVDMDAFFAAVEQRDRPELRGKPVIVGGPSMGRGVVSAASYEARKFGVHSAMPTSQAARLCPHGIFLPVDMRKYISVSRQVMQILQDYSPLVEKLSVDEAFLDLTGTGRLHSQASANAPESIGWLIKNRIRSELHLTASVGLAPNKFLAKLASDLQKPDGFVIVHHDVVDRFLRPLPIERLWGVGKATSEKLRKMGIATIGALAACPPELLRKTFGLVGDHLHQLSHGIDDRPVEPFSPAKSISAETTFAEDSDDTQFLERTLLELAEEVTYRLRQDHVRGKTVIVKIRFPDFKTITRSKTLLTPTCVTRTIFEVARELLSAGNPGGPKDPYRERKVRLLGIGVTALLHEKETQFTLFDNSEKKDERAEVALDRVREKFGEQAIRRGRLMS